MARDDDPSFDELVALAVETGRDLPTKVFSWRP